MLLNARWISLVRAIVISHIEMNGTMKFDYFNEMDAYITRYRCVNCDEAFLKFRSLMAHIEKCRNAALQENLPKDLSKDLPKDLPQPEPKTKPGDVPEEAPEKLPKDVPAKLPQEPSEDLPEETSKDYPLRSRLKSATTVSTFDCEECKESFPSETELAAHKSDRHDNRRNVQREVQWPYKCEPCQKRFRNSASFLDHQIYHKKFIKYKCSLCCRCIVGRGNLAAHMKAKHNQLQCPFCLCNLATIAEMKNHLLNHGKPKLDQNGAYHITSAVTKPPAVTKPLVVRNLKHTKSVKVQETSTKRPYKRRLKLEPRKKASSNRKVLKVKATNKSVMNNVFTCAHCKKSFNKKDKYMKHMEVHLGKGSYKCPKCSKVFRLSENLMIHMQKHKGFVPHVCKFCGKSFLSENNLKVHVSKVHKDFPVYKCDHCGKLYGTAYSLKVHKRIHTGEKVHKCTYCDQAFQYRQRLMRHLLEHKTKKVFSCRYCKKAFVHKNNMIAHVMTHGEEVENVSYDCEECGKSFLIQSSLTNHMKSHSTDRPFICKHCPKSFVYQTNLVKHMILHTKKSKA